MALALANVGWMGGGDPGQLCWDRVSRGTSTRTLLLFRTTGQYFLCC